MTAFAGAWKDRPEFADPEAYVRSLRFLVPSAYL